jgi:hypothetical protein
MFLLIPPVSLIRATLSLVGMMRMVVVVKMVGMVGVVMIVGLRTTPALMGFWVARPVRLVVMLGGWWRPKALRNRRHLGIDRRSRLIRMVM